jgi:hypothetical protein
MGAIDAPPMSVETRHIAIDVRLDGDEISGRAGDGTGRPKAFQGWLGLLLALDGLIGNTDEERSALRRRTSWSSASASESPVGPQTAPNCTPR